MTQESALHSEIVRIAGKWSAFLQRLVQIPSPLGTETPGMDFVRLAMQELGVYERDVFPGTAPPYLPTGRSYDDRGCVVGRIPGRGGPQFILNAHVDTTPVEDPTSWIHPPFAGRIENGRLYGRGALDDKAGVAMMLLIAEAFVRTGIILPGDIILEAVIEDEDSGNGTLACTEAGYYAEAGIIIDGTWPFRIIDAHLGQLWLDVYIVGQPAAACSQERGCNPIKLGMRLMEKVQESIDKLNHGAIWNGVVNPFFLNIGSVHSGAFPGAVPERCVISCQIGFAPPESTSTIFEMVKNVAKGIVKDDVITFKKGSLWVEPFQNRANSIVNILHKTIERLHPSDMKALEVAVKGHCDLRHLKKDDGSITDACLYGPGGGANPHSRNEYYLLEHFIPVAQNISSAILDWYETVAVS